MHGGEIVGGDRPGVMAFLRAAEQQPANRVQQERVPAGQRQNPFNHFVFIVQRARDRLAHQPLGVGAAQFAQPDVQRRIAEQLGAEHATLVGRVQREDQRQPLVGSQQIGEVAEQVTGQPTLIYCVEQQVCVVEDQQQVAQAQRRHRHGQVLRLEPAAQVGRGAILGGRWPVGQAVGAGPGPFERGVNRLNERGQQAILAGQVQRAQADDAGTISLINLALKLVQQGAFAQARPPDQHQAVRQRRADQVLSEEGEHIFAPDEGDRAVGGEVGFVGVGHAHRSAPRDAPSSCCSVPASQVVGQMRYISHSWQSPQACTLLYLTPGLAPLGPRIDFRSLEDFGSLVPERLSAARG